MSISLEQLSDLEGKLSGLESVLVTEAGRITGDSPEDVAKLEKIAGILDRTPAITAAGGRGESRIRRMAAQQGRVRPSPELHNQGGSRVSLVAARNWGKIRAGQEIVDRYDLAAGFLHALESGPSRGRQLVASASWQYPESRRLGDDQNLNARLIDAVCHPTALVASGGIASPVNVDYSVPTWATADRPVRDGLPSFQIDRGGLSYVPSPVMSALAAATTVWTEATDANPAGATKPVYQVSIGDPVTVFADAIPTRLGFGNMQARFAPEQFAANIDLAMAAAARIAENNLLDLLAAACTAGVTTSILLGATRDLLTAVGQAAAGLRSAYRIPSSTVLTAVFPSWVKELLRVDLARELAHAQNSDFNSLALQDDQVDDLLKARGVNAIWHLDGQDDTADGNVAQIFPVQAASSAIETFPTKLVWYLFPEGTVQFLDGGRLDLGIVRDSVLDAVNSFETFVEPFESLAFRGFTGAGLQLTSELCANGASAATVSTTSECA